jgi:hypothetical protein
MLIKRKNREKESSPQFFAVGEQDNSNSLKKRSTQPGKITDLIKEYENRGHEN